MGSEGIEPDTYETLPVPLWASGVCVLILVALLLWPLFKLRVFGQPLGPRLQLFTSFFIVGVTVGMTGIDSAMVWEIFLLLCEGSS
jgi:hypothetical protein